MAIVHSFDIAPEGIVTRLVNYHYWPKDITDDEIRKAVKKIRVKK